MKHNRGKIRKAMVKKGGPSIDCSVFDSNSLIDAFRFDKQSLPNSAWLLLRGSAI